MKLATAAITLLSVLAPAIGNAQALSVVPQGRQGAYDVYRIQDDMGLQATLLTEGAVTPEQEKQLLGLRDRVRGFNILRVRSARVLLAAGTMEVLLVPASYAYQGQDLVPFLPGGVRLHVDGAVSYDFRMLVGHYFLRLTGSFDGDEPLARRLAEAVATPAAFLKAETLGYVGDRFGALEGRIDDVEGRGSAALEGLQAKVTELERRGASVLEGVEAQGGAAIKDLNEAKTDIAVLKADTAALKSDAASIRQEQGTLRTDQAAARSLLDTTKTELESVRAALLALPTAKLEADVAALQKALGAIGPDIEALRTAVVVLQSRGGNFGRRGVDRNAVVRLVALKRGNPALTQSDAAAALKAEGISMSNKEVGLVFGIFFGDYR